MKKVLLSLASAVLLLSSCSSDENVSTVSKTGELVTKISFDGLTPKAASSTAIPATDWSNVNKIQLFLYKSDGTVAFSDVIDPSTSSNKIFKWTNVPQGVYELALVANIKSDEDNVSTSLDGGLNWVKFDAFNVVNKKINSDIFIDLKKSEFPAGHTFVSGDKAYATASEVFTAYATGVEVIEGKTTDLSVKEGALQLKREISLMRIRIDKTDKPESAPALSTVSFNHEKNFISLKNLPAGLGLKLGAFAGGIYATASKEDRIMFGASGTSTYNSTDPATGYNPTIIVDSKFTLWQDIRVLPNATKAEGKAASAEAEASRRYVLVIAGWAPIGYEYANGIKAEQAQPVYWAGTVKGVFSPNVIREVNMNIKSKGYPNIPEPQPEGELIIEVGAPENWNTNIVTEPMDV